MASIDRTFSPPGIAVFSDDESAGHAAGASRSTHSNTGSNMGMRRAASVDVLTAFEGSAESEEFFTPQTWKIAMQDSPEIPSVRYGHSAVLYDGSMYVFGGFSQEVGTMNDFWEFHIDTARWTQLEARGVVPHKRFYHTAVVHDRCMFVFGGHSGHGGTYFNDVQMYSFDRSEWVPLECRGAVPTGRRSHSACIVDSDDASGASVLRRGDMIVMGGFTGVAHSNELFRLVLGEARWELLSAAPSSVPGLKAHTACLQYGKLFICGGQTEQRADGRASSTSSVLAYDFASSAWMRLPSHAAPPESRYGHTAVVHFGQMYVFGGLEDASRGEVWRLMLRPQSDGNYEWRRLDCGGLQPRPRFFHSAVLCNDTMLVFGGYATDTVTKRKHFRNDIVELVLDPIVIPPSSLDADMRALLNAPEFSDVQFHVDNRVIFAHRSVLAGRSEVFRVMFRQQMRETLSGTVSLGDGVSYNIVMALLEFIYTDQVSLRGRLDLAMQLVPLAEQYALPRLKGLCVATIRRQIAVPTVVAILMLAERYRAPSLKRVCLDFIVHRVDEVREHGSFADLKYDPDLLYEVLQRLGVAARHA